jgi:hypothetical protein
VGNRPLRYRDLLRACSAYGVREVPGRGKGSERVWERVMPDGANKVATTVTCHGAGKELRVGLIGAVRRRLLLTPRDGVSDEEFYGRL